MMNKEMFECIMELTIKELQEHPGAVIYTAKEVYEQLKFSYPNVRSGE